MAVRERSNHNVGRQAQRTFGHQQHCTVASSSEWRGLVFEVHMDSVWAGLSKGHDFIGSIKGTITGHQAVSDGPSGPRSYSGGSYQGGDASYQSGTSSYSSYSQGGYNNAQGNGSYSSYQSHPTPPPTSPTGGARPARTSPKTSPTTEEDLDSWLDEAKPARKEKPRKAAARKKAPEAAPADLISLPDASGQAAEDPFAAFTSAGGAAAPGPADAADPFAAFASQPAPEPNPSVGGQSDDPFAAFLAGSGGSSAGAITPSPSPSPTPASDDFFSSFDATFAKPPPSTAVEVVDEAPAAARRPRVSRSASPQPEVVPQKPKKVSSTTTLVAPSPPVARTAVEKLKDTSGNKRNEQTLRDLCKLPGNQSCADCGAAYPDWASVNLGVFICLKCSGHHRNIGTHISKVRSVTLDTWSPDQMEVMQRMGNAKAKLIYEATLPADYPRPTAFSGPSEILQWIKDKYEYGRWKAKEVKPAPPSAAAGEPKVTPSARKRRPKKAASAVTPVEGPPTEEEPALP